MLGRRAGRGLGMAPAALAVIDRGPLPEQQGHHGQGHQGGPGIGQAPVAARLGDADQEHRRDRPAEVAADAMHREGMAQARRRHALVQDGEVRRVEGRVAQAGQRRRQHQPAKALRQPGCHRGERKARHRGEQHRPGADPVDQEARQRLADAGDHEEGGHQQAQLRVAQPEGGDEGREQRRQQHVKEVRTAVGDADGRDGGQVLAALRHQACGG
mmetsp:Transcript_120540/g.335638  ORF Transcript_120540/g.335638 Transcript_120540/m.335638 type:complete len:214 (+) Transcript_120540:1901-2542(+)